jgi:hypothetical protein
MKKITQFCFLIGVAFVAIADSLRGRQLAINAVLTPMETELGTESLDATAAIAFKNALVTKTGAADDRHFKLCTLVTDVPYGILQNDEVGTDEVDVVKKGIAIFGLWDDSLPGVAAAAIAVNDLLVADLATPGRVKKLPTVAGIYIVFGRSRFVVAAAGDPVSIAHCTPFPVKVGANGVAAAVWVPQNADGVIGGLNSTAVNPTKADFDALLADAEKMSDDLRALKTILDAAGITTT